MKLNFTNSENKKMSINIIKPGHDSDWQTLMSCDNRELKFEFSYDGDETVGNGIRGDDALWLPLDEKMGIKVVSDNPKYQSLESSKETVDLIKKRNSIVFPTIGNSNIVTDEDTGDRFLLITMENMGSAAKAIQAPSFVPVEHREFIASSLQVDPKIADKVVKDVTSMKLCPEDEWYKSINLINGKIVDFHRFKIMNERYYMPSNGKTSVELLETYRGMVDRYKTVLDPHGNPKWKGKIYQGFAFDNGCLMEGYLSGNDMYDSYLKLPFVPYNKCAGKKVLDIGSNQGFFSFQAALHGATSVLGIELTKQDVQAAEDIKEITKLENVEFVHGDAIKHVMESDEHYGLVVFNSVLHQIYPNFEGSDEFMTKLASMTDYLALELPLNHPLMNISPAEVESNLRKYFKTVRLLYIYNAYSSGYRANYVCYA